jgi:glycosyltransferase involved in cell wall biosynthesis
LSDGHIVLKEPLPRLALARELMRSWAMFYPTFWPETFCMSTLEAQAAGTPVITSPIGALTETVKGGICTNDFVNAVSQLRNVSRWRKLSEAGKAFAQEFSWAAIAAQWEMQINKRIQEVVQ